MKLGITRTNIQKTRNLELHRQAFGMGEYGS